MIDDANPVDSYARPGGGRAEGYAGGFTLVELVSVIVILGVLAAIALPRYISLEEEANRAALEGVAGAAGSAQALNLAGAFGESGDAEPMPDCRNTSAIIEGGRPDGYVFLPQTLSGPIGSRETCTVRQLSTGYTATFSGYHVPP